MIDQRIQVGERVVGAGHATLPDVANRFGGVEHTNDGKHGRTLNQDFAGIMRVMTPSDGGRVYEYSDVTNAQMVGAIEFGHSYNAALVLKTITGITRSGVTATATCAAHGFSNGNSILIQGANELEYNGVFTISNVAANTFDFTVSGSPATSATATTGVTIYASNGSWTRGVTGPCFLEKWLDDGTTKEIWYAPSASAGVVPVWQLFAKFDLVGGLILSTSSLYHTQRTTSSVTGTTLETTVYSTTVKGGALGKLGEILSGIVGTFSGAGGNKTFRLKYGGVTIASGVQMGAGTLPGKVALRNRNADNSQYNALVAGALLAVSVTTSSVDTSVDQTLVVTIQLANPGDYAAVEIVDTEVISKAW